MNTSLYLLRHTQSIENTMGKIFARVDGYEDMNASVREAFLDKDIEQRIKQGLWPSQDVRHVAHEIRRVFAQHLGDGLNAESDLSPLGIEQARRIGKNIQKAIPDIDVVFHSPYRRAVRTRDFLAEGWPALRNARQIADDRLSAKRMEAVKMGYSSFFVLNPLELLRAKHRGGHYYYSYRPPNGESSQDVIARVRSFLKALFDRYHGKRVFIVSHKVSIIALMAVLEDKTSQESYMELDTLEGRVSNGGLTWYVVQCEGQILHKKPNQIYY